MVIVITAGEYKDILNRIFTECLDVKTLWWIIEEHVI